MSKLVVGFPLYHWTPAAFFQRWLSLDQRDVAGCVTVNGAYITTSCETIVDQAFTLPEWDRLVILEHDMIPPKDALRRMACYTPEQAVVGAMYFEHKSPHTCLAYIDQPNGAYDPITAETVKRWVDEPALYRVDATGFGMISIARHVLENWNPDMPMFGINHEVGSHDLWFCRNARKQGHAVYVDSGIVCEHLTQIPVGLSHNQSATLPDDAKISEFAFSES